MVTITDFFGKANKVTKASKPTGSKFNSSGTAKNQVIDLDNEDDDSLIVQEVKPVKKTPIVTKSTVKEEVKSKKDVATESSNNLAKSDIKISKRLAEIKTPDVKPVVKTKETSNNKPVTAQDVLDTIASVDLSSASVKENAKFDFKNSGNAGGNGGSDGDVVGFPEGKPNCLLGLTIVFTGTLPTLERGDAEVIAKRYGAKVTKSISGKTSVVVIGEEAGPKKIEKIQKLGIKAINEEGFKQLILGMPADGGDGDVAEKARKKMEEQEAQAIEDANELVKQEEIKFEKLKAAKLSGQTVKSEDLIREIDKLWTVKYAPTNLSQICGNKSSVNKLKSWLSNWEASKKAGFKVAGRDGTGVYRSAMLYGPPGIGKTTAAHLVAKEMGYDVLEQNASDVRSKSLLNNGVKNALDNMSIVGYFKQKDNVEDVNGKKFVIIMDEVDGMSGGDRGGVGQMAQFCRKTMTPMILICNERNQPKMRPFDRVCLDVQFRRPDANSVKARLMTIAVREKFKLDPNIIDKLVQATKGDMRQIINLLSTISKTTKSIDHNNISQISKAWEKNIALKPFDITSKLFNGQIYTDLGSSSFTLNDKIALYFDDFDFTPLMIQENYLNTRPSNLGANKTHLQAVAEAADIISLGDLTERKIRSTEQLWGLLPLHAVLSSVLPASKIAGQMTGRINFTSWLGQNSKTNKYIRLLQEIQYHSTLRTQANKLNLRLEYLPTMKRKLLNPLLKEGSEAITDIIAFMDNYYLTKEDWDVVMEILVGPDNTDMALKKIPTQVKTAFTRKYNSTTHPVAIYRPGVSNAGAATTRATPDFEDIVDADDSVPPADDEEESSVNDDLKKDKLIKQKVTKRKATTKSAKTTKKRQKKA